MMSEHLIPRFQFPPLGNTGEGPVLHRGRQGEIYWRPGDSWAYYVTLQHDHPACAFRCHYPGGSSPCDQQTAEAYIRHLEAYLP